MVAAAEDINVAAVVCLGYPLKVYVMFIHVSYMLCTFNVTFFGFIKTCGHCCKFL